MRTTLLLAASMLLAVSGCKPSQGSPGSPGSNAIGSGGGGGDQIAGIWTLEVKTAGGRSTRPTNPERQTVEITAGTIRLLDGLREAIELDYRLDAGKQPKEIRLRYRPYGNVATRPDNSTVLLPGPATPGHQYEAQMHGIYALDGQELKLCITDARNPLPRDFTASGDAVLLILKRRT